MSYVLTAFISMVFGAGSYSEIPNKSALPTQPSNGRVKHNCD